MKKQRCTKCLIKHSVKIQFLFWKYTMDGLLDSCVVIWLYGTKNIAHNSLFTFDFDWPFKAKW